MNYDPIRKVLKKFNMCSNLYLMFKCNMYIEKNEREGALNSACLRNPIYCICKWLVMICTLFRTR